MHRGRCDREATSAQGAAAWLAAMYSAVHDKKSSGRVDPRRFLVLPYGDAPPSQRRLPTPEELQAKIRAVFGSLKNKKQ